MRGDGFPTWEADGFEADDVIATAYEMYGLPTLIISADKDLLALVCDRVSVKSPISGNVMDPAAVQEKFGVAPNQMRDYLTIVGDTSDGVVGVKDIGAKGAAALLQTFGNLDDLYAAIDRGDAALKPAQATALMDFRPRLPIVRQLLALRTDASVPFDEILKDRVPADAAVFGGEGDTMMDDINEAMPTRPGILPQDNRELNASEATDALGTFVQDVARRVTKPGPSPQGLVDALNRLDTVARAAGHQPVTNPTPAAPVIPPTQEDVRSRVDRAVDASVVVSESLVPVAFDRQLEPRNLDEARTLAKWAFESRQFHAYGTPQAVLMTFMAGRELGYPAMASLRAFHIVEGKPTLAADFIRALVLKSGLVNYFRCTERTAERATFEAQRGDDPPIKLSYSVEEAKAAGIVKNGSGWTKSPADMCVARASSKLARLIAPEVVFGLYAPEEFDNQ